jgi:hypothetical protein
VVVRVHSGTFGLFERFSTYTTDAAGAARDFIAPRDRAGDAEGRSPIRSESVAKAGALLAEGETVETDDVQQSG